MVTDSKLARFARIENKRPWLFLLMLLFVAGWFLRQMWQIGFTTGDDVATSGLSPKVLLEMVVAMRFSDLGYDRPTRFFGTLLNYVRTVVFGYKHFGFRLSAILPILTEVGLFTWFYSLLFQTKKETILVSVLLIASMQHAWTHHSLAAFIFNFHFAFSLVLGSFCLAYISFRNLSVKLALLSGILFGSACLVYEMFTVYVAIFPFVFFLCHFRYHRSGLIEKKSNRSLFCLAAGALPISVAFLYLAFAYLSPLFSNQYGGTKAVSKFVWSQYWNTLEWFSKSALPGRIFNYYRGVVGEYLGISNISGFEAAIFELRYWPIWSLIGLVAGFSIYQLLIPRMNKVMSIGNFMILFLISVILVLAPNALVSLTEAHQQKYLYREITYSGTYFSIFGWAILVGVLSIAISYIRIKFLQKLLVFYFIAIGAIAIYRTQIGNSAIASIQSLQHSRWRLLEQLFMEDRAFDEILKSGKVIRTSDTMFGKGEKIWWIFHPKGSWADDVYWSNYTKIAYGQSLPIYKSPADCLNQFGSTCFETPYELRFQWEFPETMSVMSLCDHSSKEGESCITRRYSAWL